jgi:hypothetical protein
MKTAEEILREELSQYYMDIINKQDEEGHTTFKDWIIEAMDRFAAQSKQKEQEKPRELTDEEIDKMFPIENDIMLNGKKDYRIDQINFNNRMRREGARQVRSQFPEKEVCSNCNKVHEYSEDICYVKFGSKT